MEGADKSTELWQHPYCSITPGYKQKMSVIFFFFDSCVQKVTANVKIVTEMAGTVTANVEKLPRVLTYLYLSEATHRKCLSKVC